MKKALMIMTLIAGLAAAAVWQLESRLAERAGQYETRELSLPELASRKPLAPALAVLWMADGD